MPGESVVLYKTRASVTSGGRDHGIARSDDGRLEVRLEMPKELGGSGEDGTNPEQLFAAGWAGCFMSALKTVARNRADLSHVVLTVEISILQSPEGDFDLAAILDLDPIDVSGADPAELMRDAHSICPYSRGTRGNIDVVLKVSGQP